MTNQDLIVYQESIKDNNTALINQLNNQNTNLNQSIIGLETQISQIQVEISTNNQKITLLQQDNIWIDETIAYLPTDGSAEDLIDYQNTLKTANNLSINQINQQNTELNLSIFQIQNQINQTRTQINNNNDQISILQQDNIWIDQTITYIPN